MALEEIILAYIIELIVLQQIVLRSVYLEALMCYINVYVVNTIAVAAITAPVFIVGMAPSSDRTARTFYSKYIVKYIRRTNIDRLDC